MAKKKRRTRVPSGIRTKEREILAKLKEADGLLGQYRQAAQAIANDLAVLKSLYVFGRVGGYRGHLGCYEEGADKICLHIQPKFQGKSYRELERRIGSRPMDFEIAWARKANEAGVRFVCIGGHF